MVDSAEILAKKLVNLVKKVSETLNPDQPYQPFDISNLKNTLESIVSSQVSLETVDNIIKVNINDIGPTLDKELKLLIKNGHIEPINEVTHPL